MALTINLNVHVEAEKVASLGCRSRVMTVKPDALTSEFRHPRLVKLNT
jgi:hypothetical protein